MSPTTLSGSDYSGDRLEYVSISGFKSIASECAIKIRPLTVLSGANSSGKSSAIQPLLMLKQTIEASPDPGPLLINGPNVRFTSAKQFQPRLGREREKRDLCVMVGLANGTSASLRFSSSPKRQLQLTEATYGTGSEKHTIRPQMSHDELWERIPEWQKPHLTNFMNAFEGATWQVVRDRCFLRMQLGFKNGISYPGPYPDSQLVEAIRGIIHVKGLRGNPERTYRVSAVGGTFPGPFEEHVASLLRSWEDAADPRLQGLWRGLEHLGLTPRVKTRQLDDVQVEVRVGRLPHGRSGQFSGMVSIADVGLGVSQVLPVLTALVAAAPGQTVYLEQPEIHLHPAAQVGLATVMADAAKRGVVVIVETHSVLLLLAIQTLVAEGGIHPDLVILHWFARDERGETHLTSSELDSAGSFGDWPTDFLSLPLELEARYLNAARAAVGHGN